MASKDTGKTHLAKSLASCSFNPDSDGRRVSTDLCVDSGGQCCEGKYSKLRYGEALS